MEASTTATLVTGFVTAAIALVGYGITQHQKRRERRSVVYAAALEAFCRYEQLPYLIRRRKDSSDVTRANLAVHMSAVSGTRRYHETLLRMDSLRVAAAYEALIEQTRRRAGLLRTEAWQAPVITRDSEVPGTAQVSYNNGLEWDLCLFTMRRELSIFGFMLGHWTRRRIKNLIDCRAGESAISTQCHLA